MTTDTSPPITAAPVRSLSLPRLALIVIALAVVGIWFVLHFAKAQEQHEMLHWQNKLGLIADSRSADVSSWLQMHEHELAEVANNPSLQLYLSVLLTPAKSDAAAKPDAAKDKDEPAQQVFLRNLLVVTADRLGFLNKDAQALKDVHANVHHPMGTGIAIIGLDGKVIVSTEGLAVLDAGLAARVARAPRGQPSLIDLFDADGEKHIGFVLPIYPIQGDATAAQQIGMLVAVKAVGDDLLKLLVQPGATEKSLEATLVRRSGDNVDFLTLPPDSGKLAATFALTTPDLDAADAILHPGDFSLARDAQGHTVLMTSRAISGSPWTLLLHIDRNEALSTSDSWRIKMEIIMFLGLIAFIACIVAAWWYGTSKRAMLLSEQTSRLAAHSMAQERLLRLVTDNQPEPIFIADSNHIVRFANEKAARLFKLAPADATGKDLSALLGAAGAKLITQTNTTALESQKPLSRTQKMGEEADARIMRSEHIPLAHIPIDSLPYPSPGVLVVEQDITDIVHERERRERILHQLVGTLVHMVDARDPNAANHSALVAMVAREVAQSLGLDPLLVDTAETAGNLMNIGKLVVPSAVLTKRTALGEDEIQAIRESLAHSVALLKEIDFDGPVAETLRQSAERYDGTGPLGLAGEGILVTARIIAVANSFVGMISARAWRPANTIEQATALLLDNIDTQFDRRVVIALINFVENQKGRQMLASLMAVKKAG